MKLVKHILMTATIVVGLSVATFAQKGGDKKPPPKNPPPVINPTGPKAPPPKETKPKKPGVATFFWKEEETISQ